MATKYTFGNIDNVKEGDIFSDRKMLRKAGIHLALQAGIDGNSKEGSPSIVLNGGYEDDEDYGDVIIYTGHGGNDPNTKKQIADQSWDDTGNKALLISEMQGNPVRVTRGAKHKSKFSPKVGYQYAGLYQITQHFEETGKNGFLVCRYKLEKINNLSAQPLGDESSTDKKPTRRIETSIMRIVRDTKLSQEVKKIYDYCCQVCGIEISVHNVKYAEGAHIKPLGTPHNGHDSKDNILCLCPNHHVMLDKGVYSIKDDLELIGGVSGKLFLKPSHKLNKENLKYHRESHGYS